MLAFFTFQRNQAQSFIDSIQRVGDALAVVEQYKKELAELRSIRLRYLHLLAKLESPLCAVDEALDLEMSSFTPQNVNAS